MMGARRPQDGDLDDWFDEPETSDAWTRRVDRIAAERHAPPIADDWIRDSAPARDDGNPPRPSRAVLAGVGALLLVLIFGALAAVGVFSGSKPKASALITTPPTTRASTQTATTPARSSVPAGPLKPGDTGAAVKKLQRALTQAGYSPGTIDGSYGSATTQAVSRFQTAHQLTADGVAGPQTLAALKSALQTG